MLNDNVRNMPNFNDHLYREFPGWRIVKIIDSNFIEVTCDYDVVIPQFGNRPLFRENYRIRAEGLPPHFDIFTETEMYCYKIPGYHHPSDLIDGNSKYFQIDNRESRIKKATEFVRHHLLTTVLKFDAHNYLYCFLGIRVKQITKIQSFQGKVFVSYSFQDRPGKGSTILSYTKIRNYASEEVIGFLPVLDPYYFQHPHRKVMYKDEYPVTGYRVTIPGEETIFITGRVVGELGYVRINQLPIPNEDIFFRVDIDQLSHCYNFTFCFYDAVFAKNDQQGHAYKSQLLHPLPAKGFTKQSKSTKPKQK